MYRKVKKIIKILANRFRNRSTSLAGYRKAIRWIRSNTIINKGIKVHHQSKLAYPEVSGYLIPTLLNFGEHELALQYARWLIGIQNADGSWSDAKGDSAYSFDTGQILKGLLAINARLPEVEASIIRGCDWLTGQIDDTGRIRTPATDQWKLPGGYTISGYIHLYALEPLIRAGKIYARPEYSKAAERAIQYYLTKADLTDFNNLTHIHAYILEALIDLGHEDKAREAMKQIGSIQAKNGSVQAYPDVSWTCSTGVAQYALIWYKLGDKIRGDKAFDYLLRTQNRSGGFYGSYGRNAVYFNKKEISWGIKYFLDAFYWHILSSFNEESMSFPTGVGDQDGRYVTVLDNMPGNSGARILEAGSGTGRFLLKLSQTHPDCLYHACDLSDRMLSFVPEPIQTRQATLLNMPYSNDHFDYVFTVEALEHSLNYEAAVSELVRITRPGGKIVIIDKNKQKRGAIQTESWENWFSRSSVENWLSRGCSEVKSEFISYKKHKSPDGLFIAWTGIKK